MQMAQAYGTFANGGVMNDAHLITKIENASGQVVRSHSQKSTRVLSGSTTDKMTQYDAGNPSVMVQGQCCALWLYHGRENRYDRDQL